MYGRNIVMKKDERITSEMLERYLLGETTDVQTAEVEARLSSDQELRVQYEVMESDFERLAQENAIDPPTEVKEHILTGLEQYPKAVHAPSNFNRFYLAIAAVLILLLAITSFWMYAQWNNIQSDLEVVQNEKELLLKNIKSQQSQWNNLMDKYALIMAPDTEKYVLNGNDKAPNAQAIGYLNHKNKAVILDAQHLPPLPNNRDYQLWADVAGEMIDMGVIQKGESLLTMTYIDRAESFNITIEPFGGSDHPTVANLIANAYLK